MSMTRTRLNDSHFMGIAIGLARRGHGNVSPNPSVGCVIVNDAGIVGRGWTQPGGRPHAETEAIARAGAAAKGATAYVTLEPCAHHGETPPCAQALIDAGIGRVVIGTRDPDPRVQGGGVAMLTDAGIEVTEGVRMAEAREAALGFLMRVEKNRPLVTVKLATTLDGRIATTSGHSQWITGPVSRALGHGLRARNDAILVGSRTALLDDPSLTCRLPGLEGASPIRVVVDARLVVPLTHKLVSTATEVPTWILTRADGDAERRKAFQDAGVRLIDVALDADGNIDLTEALKALATLGVTRLMVEGGGRIIAGLLAADLVDRLVWFRASKLIGGDGVSAVAAFGVQVLDEAANFVKVSSRPAGADFVETYARDR
ncbi:MAG: diaminohydroxyphosphoribosylaminopyrimidine deaminase [Paracoccaceae bacterium]|jgi:diaminohydroxyphosphoribosylaminopyrimidine deaminase/5-amino-6-(5-phosphoribosylamino)uracil reductase